MGDEPPDKEDQDIRSGGNVRGVDVRHWIAEVTARSDSTNDTSAPVLNLFGIDRFEWERALLSVSRVQDDGNNAQKARTRTVADGVEGTSGLSVRRRLVGRDVSDESYTKVMIANADT